MIGDQNFKNCLNIFFALIDYPGILCFRMTIKILVNLRNNWVFLYLFSALHMFFRHSLSSQNMYFHVVDNLYLFRRHKFSEENLFRKFDNNFSFSFQCKSKRKRFSFADYRKVDDFCSVLYIYFTKHKYFKCQQMTFLIKLQASRKNNIFLDKKNQLS